MKSIRYRFTALLFLFFSLGFSQVFAQNNLLADTSLQSFSPEDKRVLYVGRIDFEEPKKPVFSAPGVYIKAKFRGVSCTVLLQDEFLYGRKNCFDVYIDKKLVAKLTPEKEQTHYQVAKGLRYGLHDLMIVKRTESSIGRCTFLGLEIGGTLEARDLPSARKMLIIGNSISCGSGNEAKKESPECVVWNHSIPFSNAHMSFGAIAARNLKADYHLVAVSGIGAVRNYSSTEATPMPAIFTRMHLADSQSKPYDMSQFVPDAILIELGTNDFSPGDNAAESPRHKMQVEEFVSHYIRFVENLRTLYPRAMIFCLSSPMLSDGWPDATYRSASDLNAALKQVGNYYSQLRIKNVIPFYVSKVEGKGCTTHPLVEEHEFTAGEIVPFVRKRLGWE